MEKTAEKDDVRSEEWVTIPEENVRHIWAPDEAADGEGEISVSPSWYSENGTPVDPETGNDMSYVRTEVRSQKNI